MPGPKDNVTMKTIAREAGVSLPTVSRILNNKGGKYADKTKKKIFDIADRLKYRPNALVLGMQTGKTGTAGVMVSAASLFYTQVVAGIHEVFLENNTIMLLSWNNRSVNRREEVLERQIIHQMIDRRVEGIILRPSSEEFERSYFEEIWEREIPLILVDREMSKIDADFVGTDDRKGGHDAAEHLISLGHRNLLFIGSEKTITSFHREEGFRNVLSETPNAFCQPTISFSPDRTDSTEQKPKWDKLHQRLQGPQAPTAIFCYNDDTARAVAAFMLKAGISIPGDISVLGFGNVPASDGIIPLTTFEQHPGEIGAAAARIYLERTNGPEHNGILRKIIPADLLIRGSTRSIS